MKKKKIILGAVFAVMYSLMVAGPASAAHCVEGDSPGFTYFGQDGREENDNPLAPLSAVKTPAVLPSALPARTK